MEGVELPVLESRGDGGDDVAVPEDIDEGISFEGGSAECAGLEEVDLVVLSRDGLERGGRGEGSWEVIGASGRSEQGNTAARVGVGLEVEDGGIEGSASRAGADPVSVRGGEAEVAAGRVSFESSIDDVVLAAVSTREGDLEITLTGVGGAGSVGDDEVLNNVKVSSRN